MADRYTYIPLIGIFIIVAWAAAKCSRHSPSAVRPILQVANSLQKQEVIGGRHSESACYFQARAALALVAAAILGGCLIITHGQLAYWTNSERLFRHALAVTGDNTVSCENLGDSLLHQRRYAEAVGEFRKVLAFDAKHYTQTPVELADALEGLGRREEAIACLQEAVRINPDNGEAIAKLAILGRIAEAIQLLNAAIVLHPDEARLLQRLAWIYATCPDHRFRNGLKAVEFAQRACALTDRKNAHCLQTLADAYREAKDPTRAAEALRAARLIDHGDAATD